MTRHRLVPALLGLGCISLSACQIPNAAGPSKPIVSTARTSAKAAPIRTAPTSAVPRSRPESATATATPTSQMASAPSLRPAGGGRPVNLVGLDEQQVRALLGPPVAEEERPPAKIWRYRKGGCSLNLSLYPDVQTRKFGTLTYEVKSDDNTDEGKRNCLADIQPRADAK